MARRGEWVGLKEANAALKRLPQYARDAAQHVMDVTAFQVAAGAQRRVRVRTGFLKARIRWQSRPRSLSAVVGIEPAAFYWRFLEYGTVKMGASPFLRPAAEAMRDDHQQRLRMALEKAADHVEQDQRAGMTGLV